MFPTKKKKHFSASSISNKIMIKGLYNGHIWLVDELRKTVKKTVDCNRDFIYIVYD